MKALSVTLILGLFTSGQALAGHELIGHTKECQIRTTVIKATAGHKKQLLVVHDRNLYTLELVKKIGSMELYASDIHDAIQLRELTFDATIMGKDMSRLSELRIYLSGAMYECMIDR